MAFILGYERREQWADLGRLWPSSRRDLYLLRPDVDKPLSVDVMVWPTVFRDGSVETLRRTLDDRFLGDGGVPLPSFVGPCMSLWLELLEMQRATASLRCRPSAKWDRFRQ